MGKRDITKQREKLLESLASASDRFDHWLNNFDREDAIELEYFAHGMEGVIGMIQEVANDAGYLAELIDPNVREKV